MKIAVTYQNGNVFQHFGHTEQFKIFTAEDGKIVASEVIDTLGSGHGALAGLLKAEGVNVLICGGIGGGARNALSEAEIKIYGGVSGSVDKAAQAFVDGELAFDPNATCSHHGEGHGHSHTCGDHDCGSHSCH